MWARSKKERKQFYFPPRKQVRHHVSQRHRKCRRIFVGKTEETHRRHNAHNVFSTCFQRFQLMHHTLSATCSASKRGVLFRPTLLGVFCTVIVWSTDLSVSSEDSRPSFDDLLVRCSQVYWSYLLRIGKRRMSRPPTRIIVHTAIVFFCEFNIESKSTSSFCERWLWRILGVEKKFHVMVVLSVVMVKLLQ